MAGTSGGPSQYPLRWGRCWCLGLSSGARPQVKATVTVRTPSAKQRPLTLTRRPQGTAAMVHGGGGSGCGWWAARLSSPLHEKAHRIGPPLRTPSSHHLSVSCLAHQLYSERPIRVLPCPAVYCQCAALCLAVLGCAWLCLAVLGCAWLCLAVLGCDPVPPRAPCVTLVTLVPSHHPTLVCASAARPTPPLLQRGWVVGQGREPQRPQGGQHGRGRRRGDGATDESLHQAHRPHHPVPAHGAVVELPYPPPPLSNQC
jgi:hypothetical protein